MRRLRLGKNIDEEHSAWMGFTDLMSGLVVLFMLIGSAVYISTRNEINNLRREYEILKAETDIAREKLEKENTLKNLIHQYEDVFSAEDPNIQAEFDDLRGSIVLRKNGNSVFQSGESVIDPQLSTYLDRIRGPFLRKSMDLWEDNHLENLEIRIEGHTDPTPIGWYSDAFLDNLYLSSDRANNVFKYLLEHAETTDAQKQFMMNYMISVGYSYSRCLNEGNDEDETRYGQYRTIEFRIISK